MNYDTKILPESNGINMLTIVIYFYLFIFWLNESMGFQLESFLGSIKGLSFQNLCLYLLIIAWALTIKTRDSFIQKNNVNKYMFLVIIIMTISIFANLNGYGVQTTSLKIEVVIFKNFINPWLFFFLIASLIKDKRTCERLISALILFLLATIFMVLLHNYLGIRLAVQKDNLASIGRSAGFSEVNQYAAFLVLFLPLFLSSIFFQEDLSKKIKGFFFLLLGMIGLVSTVSKGGFIAFFVSIGYFFIISYRKRMLNIRTIFISLFLIVLLGASSYFLLPSQAKEVAKNRITLEEGPFDSWAAHDKSLASRISSGRTSIWMYSLAFIVQRPIFGYGKNQLGFSPHSEPIGWLIDYGIIGFFLFIMIYIKIYRHVTYYIKRSTNPHTLIVYFGYISGFVGYVVAMSGVNLHEPRYIFWIYTAIIYKYTQLDPLLED